MVSRQKALSKVFGDPQKKLINKLQKRVDVINGLAEKYAAMSDDELRQVKHVIIVGCGTAYFAGVQASYFIEQLTDDVTISVEIASELRYRAFNVPEHSVAMIVSQSGETADTLACLNELKRRGASASSMPSAVQSPERLMAACTYTLAPRLASPAPKPLPHKSLL